MTDQKHDVLKSPPENYIWSQFTLSTWLHIKSFLYSAWHLHADRSTDSKDSVAWSNLVTGSSFSWLHTIVSQSRDFLRILSEAQRLCRVVDATHLVGSVLAGDEEPELLKGNQGHNFSISLDSNWQLCAFFFVASGDFIDIKENWKVIALKILAFPEYKKGTH